MRLTRSLSVIERRSKPKAPVVRDPPEPFRGGANGTPSEEIASRYEGGEGSS